MIAISVKGISGLEVEVNHLGSLISLSDLVKNLKSDGAKPLISGIELTKLMNSSGCYMLYSQAKQAHKACKKVGGHAWSHMLAAAGQNGTVCKQGVPMLEES
jgi:hypothetical protein